MGNSAKAQFSTQKQFPFEILEIEACEPSANITQTRQVSWFDSDILYTDHKLIVISNNIESEEIPINSNFQILNEQPENCVLTIQFYSTKSQQMKTWKIKPKMKEDFKSWKKSLKALMKNNWSMSKCCEICGKSFGIVKRKHHCRKCFKCVCAKCSPFRSTLPELAYTELVRICFLCSEGICSRRKGACDTGIPNFTLINAKRNSKSEKNLVLS